MILIATCLASSAWAQPSERLPKGDRTVSAEHWCFDLEESKNLLKLDRDHTACLATEVLLSKQKEALGNALTNLNEAVRVAEEGITVLKGENDRMFDLWTEENKKRHLAENKPNFSAWVGWGATMVVTGILTGVLLAK